MPKSGIVTCASKTSNTNIKAAIGVIGIGTVATATYGFPSSVYLPKGTKVFNRRYSGNEVGDAPASYSGLNFFPAD